MKKIGFIGFGNMAEAIITGLISSGNFKSNEIGAFDTEVGKLQIGADRLKITAFESNEELVNNCECIVLAVKPIALQKVIEPLKENLRKANPLVISIAAGQSIDKLRNLIGFDAAIVRVMPNINAIAGQAVSGYVSSDNVKEEQLETAIKILNSFGTCVAICEEKFSAYSAIAGCSPAYAYLIVDSIARVGVKYGLTKKESLDIVSATVIETIKKNKKTDSTELDNVVLKAIEKAYNKDIGMGK